MACSNPAAPVQAQDTAAAHTQETARNASVDASGNPEGNTALTVKAALAATVIDASAWPPLECTKIDVKASDLLREIRYGFRDDDGERMRETVLVPGTQASAAPVARLVAACIASLKGDHASASALLTPLADESCSGGVLALSNVAESSSSCAWSADVRALAKRARVPPVQARQLSAIAALRSGDAAAIRAVLAPVVELSFDCSVCSEEDSPAKPERLRAASAAKKLASTEEHHLTFGDLMGCDATTCTFTAERLTHSSSVVDSVTVDPKTGKITKVTGTDG